jgi:release factor glutamine methyltransferase
VLTLEIPDLALYNTFNILPPEVNSTKFKQDLHLLALLYAGGINRIEITNKLLEQLRDILYPELGVAYILLYAQNKPN